MRSSELILALPWLYLLLGVPPGQVSIMSWGAERPGPPAHVVAVEQEPLDLVIEGSARKTRDDETLRRVAERYATIYDWHVTVRDGAFHDTEGAPTAGPPPYDVYEVTPRTAFGLPVGESFGPTRWHFGQS
mgnify:CR=1 FL=1